MVGSAEREHERLRARVEELDLEPTIVDGTRLADQLIHPRNKAAVVREHPSFPVPVRLSMPHLWDEAEVKAWVQTQWPQMRTQSLRTIEGRANVESAGREDLKRFHLRVAGPGRGHRGPIAIYAEAHRCSRSTAWRRLKAEAA
jgi:hypothetical protein